MSDDHLGRVSQAGTSTRLNTQEIELRSRLDALPEFSLAGYQTGEMRTFRGIVIRRGGSVRGLWSFVDGHYRWLPVACNSEAYATASIDRALRHTMLLILKALLVRRSVRRTAQGEPMSVDRILAARVA